MWISSWKFNNSMLQCATTHKKSGPAQAVPRSNFDRETRNLHAFHGQRSSSCQTDTYFQEEDRHNAVNTNQDGFFGDTYDQQENLYSHEPFNIPIAPPVRTPQDNFYSHKNPENYDAFQTQESDPIDAYVCFGPK